MSAGAGLELRPFSRVAETASAETIERVQWARLKLLLEWVYAASPFYRQRLDIAGAQPDRIHGMKDFRRRVPLLRKADVVADQEASPPFGHRLCVRPDEVVQIHSSGGTTGRAREVYALTRLDMITVASVFSNAWHFAGVRPGDPVALTFPNTLSGAGVVLTEVLRRLGAQTLPLGSYDTLTKLRAIRQFGARVLIATPSYLTALATTARDELGWDPARDLGIEVILTATEAFSVERAEAIERAWGAKLFEWYGSAQHAAASTCELGAVHDGGRGLLHHTPHLSMMETLDPETGEGVAYGEEGEVVVTYLGAQASPLLRYATNDKALLLPGSSCPCGRARDGYEAGTIGRYDDMMKVRGVSFWPMVTDDVVFGVPGVANYFGTVRHAGNGAEEVRVELELGPDVEGDDRAAVVRRVGERLRSTIGLQMEVVEAERVLPAYVDSESKAHRWKDERRR
jgi:phenylacetate-CoA ligase